MFSSTNKGESWQAVNGGISKTIVTAIGEYRGEIWTGSLYNAVHAYNPVTERWTDRDQGMHSGSIISEFVVVKDTLYATDRRSGPYRWNSDSSIWNKMPIELSISSIYSDLIALDDTTLIVTSEYPYRINLTTWAWKRLPLGLFSLHDIEKTEDRLYIASDSGVYYSTDRGDSWVRLLANRAKKVTTTPESIFVHFSDGALIRSMDHGQSWDTLSNSLALEVFNGVLYGFDTALHVLHNDGSIAATLTPWLSDVDEVLYVAPDLRIFASTGDDGLYQFVPSSNVENRPVIHSLVYPNPASQSVTLPGGKKTVVINSLGQLIYTSGISAPIDVSHWSDGAYFYRIESTEGVQTGRFLVRH